MHDYDHHIGDYTRDTVGLAMIEDGAYRRLLDQCYASELPLPSEKAELYRMARAATPSERKAVDYVLGRFFVPREDGYHNARADKEIAKFHGKSGKAKAAAIERWDRERERKANANAHPNADANAHPNADANESSEHAIRNAHHAHAQPPSTLHPPPSTLHPSANLGSTPPGQGETSVDGRQRNESAEEWFGKFWAVYPKKEGKKDALQAWHKLKPTPDKARRIIAAVERKKRCYDWTKEEGRYVPWPATYLRGERFEDEPPAGSLPLEADSVPFL